MTFEQFDPLITPEHSMFNNLHKYHAWQNTVIESNSQFETLMVRLSTIWHMLIESEQNEASNQNHQLSIASSRSCRLIKHNYSNIDLKGLLFKSVNNNSDLAKLQYIAKERRKVKNMLSELIDNPNLEVNSLNDSTLQELDEELSELMQQIDEETFWLMQEYYRLSSLPNLADSDTKRMLLILELAQFDPLLDYLINQIDTAIAEETGLTDIPSDNISNQGFKKLFIQCLEKKLNSSEDIG
ncbi:hypothetical protein NIES4071_31550 [Calothrix sp. NIES-4071]|nr:hypothetical protein NIES4071_31550 [Calothrix sp. NIES-4071]BAZ57475.1 hypothetical protein NIES4105_31490 [Calothrix sp. NIES-4105]